MDALGASPVTFSMAPFAHRVRRGSVCARTVQSKSAKHVRQATNSEITSVVATSYMTVVSNAMLTAAQSVSMDSFSLRCSNVSSAALLCQTVIPVRAAQSAVSVSRVSA